MAHIRNVHLELLQTVSDTFKAVGVAQEGQYIQYIQLLLLNLSLCISPPPPGMVRQIADKMYTDFAGPQNWSVYPDVVPTLHALRQKGLVLGVISNFDERLKPILKSLKLADLFDFVLGSYEAGFCKPDPRLVLGRFGDRVQLVCSF